MSVAASDMRERPFSTFFRRVPWSRDEYQLASVIPVKAGIQILRGFLDPGFRRGDVKSTTLFRLVRGVFAVAGWQSR
jgi:hypothetical protein